MNRTQNVISAAALAVCQLAMAQVADTPPVDGPASAAKQVAPDGQLKQVDTRPKNEIAPVGSSGVPRPVQPAPDSAQRKDDSSAAEREPRIMRGNDLVIAPPKPQMPFTGSPIALNFEEAPIADVVRVVLGDVMQVNYAMHPPIAGTVTLSTRTPVSPSEAAFLLESALQANGLAMSRDARGIYHVGRPDALKALGIVTSQPDRGNLPPGLGVVIVPLKYIGAGEMAAILRPMVPGDALIRVDSVRNLLVLAGTRTQAEAWLDLVSTFDVDLLKGMSVGVFPLKYASVAEVEAALKLLNPGAAGAGSTAAAPAGVASLPAAGAARAASPIGLSESNPLFGAIRVMPIERINSILVVTPRAAYLDEARAWIEKLDKPSENGTDPQLFVYPVQNGSARQLAAVLGGIFGDPRQASTQAANSGVAPGLTQATSSTGMTGFSSSGTSTTSGFGSNSLTNRAGTTTQGQATGQSTGVTAVSLISGVRLIADEVSNALLVYASRSEYNKIESALKRLDVPPTQVLIEASILEVTLTDDLQYGLQWAFTRSGNNGTGTGVLSTVAGGVLGAAKAGFSYSFQNKAGNVQAVLNALADKSLVNVISSPSLMVQSNYTAKITVGDQQPIKTGDTTYVTGTTGAVSSSYQYKDTGVSLSVRPTVNAGDMVTLEINQAVTDVGSVDAATQQRSFLQRQIQSQVAVRSGETLVLGGLIKDNNTNDKSGLPLLSSIPVVGALFGTHTTSGTRTELLVTLTPRVVRSDQEIRDVSGELRDRMRSLSSLVVKNKQTLPKEPEPVGTVSKPAELPSTK